MFEISSVTNRHERYSFLVINLDYAPKIKAPNAKPSTKAPMMIIAV